MTSNIHPPSIMPPLLLVVVYFVLASPRIMAFSIAKPGCDDRCGDASIPFPFGTREDCYRDERFFLECRNSSNNNNNVDPPKLVFGGSTMVIKDISLGGQLRIWADVGYDCYDGNTHTRSGYSGPSMSLGNLPLAFNGTANKFTAIGRDTSAIVEGFSEERKYSTGCMSICDRKEDVRNGSCSGIGCCQTSIPNGARQIKVRFDSYYNHSRVSDFNPCTYGFVIEEAAFEFFVDNLTYVRMNLGVPVVVDWVISYEKCEEAMKNKSSYACSAEHSVCYDQDGALGYRCMCEEGFEGNPYLPFGGCKDIDECANSNLNNCGGNSTCVNLAGNYTCQCNEGYHGDGRKNGEGCNIPDQQRHKTNILAIFAGVGGSLGAVVVLAFFFCLYFEMMRRKSNKLRKEFFRRNGGLILQEKLIEQRRGKYTTKIFTDEELRKATNDFDRSQIIGRGGFGTVFKGELNDKTKVAIKRSIGVDQQQVEQFINEVIVLSGINNRNVVKLLGCCLEKEVPLLVYEFIDNETLSEHIHNKIKASKLSWNIRLRIASEVAGVLSYLHSVASPPIIHRDIKSANILLDHNYTAKVADFGASRLIPMDVDRVTTVVQGTHGYLDPEYMQTGMLTEKSDVYSFGVVLVELLTGKRVIASDRPEAERFLSNHFLYSLQNGHLVEVFDSKISSDENIKQLKEAAMIAKKCISVKGEDRPYMKDVARELEAMGVKTDKQFPAQAFDIAAFVESESLIGLKSKGHETDRDRPVGRSSTSDDLYSVCHTITEQMLLPIAGGR